MTSRQKVRDIELRVKVFELAEEMARRPNDDVLALEFRRV